MTLHPDLLSDLLDKEIEAARTRLASRFVSLDRHGNDVMCVFDSTNVGRVVMRLDGRNYDSEPFRVTVIEGDGSVAPSNRWPGNLCLGPHPLLGYPCVCIRGTYEYHAHPQHLADRWDTHRASIRLPYLLKHLLRKAGV